MQGPRACRPDEYDETVALINSIFRAGTDQDSSTDYPLALSRANLCNMRVIEEDGRIVCHAAVAVRTVIAAGDLCTIGIIASVATDPAYRHRGYGTKCVADCIRIMGRERVDLSLLWTMESTFPFYQQLGWEAVESQGVVYRLSRDDASLFDEGPFRVIERDPNGNKYVDDIMRIHDGEPYRVARSRSDYRALLALPKTSTYVAVSRGVMQGYLVYADAVNKSGIIEAGGAPAAIESLIRHVLLTKGTDKTIQALSPRLPTTLGKLLARKRRADASPIEVAKGFGYQMVRINDLRGFLATIESHLRESSAGLDGEFTLICQETGESVTLRFIDGVVDLPAHDSPNRVVLSGRQLVRLIFGPVRKADAVAINEPAGEILNRMLPYHFTVWQIDHC